MESVGLGVFDGDAFQSEAFGPKLDLGVVGVAGRQDPDGLGPSSEGGSCQRVFSQSAIPRPISSGESSWTK